METTAWPDGLRGTRPTGRDAGVQGRRRHPAAGGSAATGSAADGQPDGEHPPGEKQRHRLQSSSEQGKTGCSRREIGTETPEAESSTHRTTARA